MSIRKFFALLIALAVLLAPSVAAAAEQGMTVANHQVQMMEVGHCQPPASPHGNVDKNAGHSCCISVSMGLAAAPAVPLLEALGPQAPPMFELLTLHLSELVEIATPPPRHS